MYAASLSPQPSPSPAGSGTTAYVSSKLAFVAPIVPGFVRRAVPTFGFGRHTAAPTSEPPVSIPVSIPVTTTTKASGGHQRSWSSDMVVTAGIVTPPPSYSEALAPILTPLKYARRMASEKASVAAAVEMLAGRRPPPVESPQQPPTGIIWKVANQGINLLQQAASESEDAESPALGRGTSFSRRLYINGLSYLLQALPSDLTRDEAMSLSAALPSCLAPEVPPTSGSPFDASSSRHDHSYFPPHVSYDAYDGDADVMYPDYDDRYQVQAAPASTLLYRVSSLIIVKTFVLITIIIPWLQFLFATALRLNREHRVTERLFDTTLSTADIAARAAVTVSSSLVALQSGPIGRVVEGAITWWVRGVSGGVYDGMGEGLAVLGLREQNQQQRSTHPTNSHSHAYGSQYSPRTHHSPQRHQWKAEPHHLRSMHASFATGGKPRQAQHPHRRALPTQSPCATTQSPRASRWGREERY